MKALTVLLSIFALAINLTAQSAEIEVTSPAFKSGGIIPSEFTCKGAEKSPPLQFQGVPRSAKTLVLIMDDPDAPGGLFTHWLVWNIKSSTTKILTGVTPEGASEGTNDFGKPGYGGPCPPAGTHHYIFHLYALDTKLRLAGGAKRGQLEKAFAGHILARGKLIGRCSR